MKRVLIVVTVLVIAGLLVACGAAQVASTPTAAPTTPAEEPTETPVQEPTETPTEPSRDLSTPAPEIEAEVVDFLAGELDVAAEELEVVSVEPVVWNDASLGCPEPGEVYAQVVTPGYRVVVRAGGTEYEVHTDETGGTMVRCPSDEAGDGRGVDGQPVEAVVRTELAAELGLEPTELELSSKEEVEWPNAALGCPEPDKQYAEVIVPGFRLVFEGPEDTEYTVHTDETGDRWLVCEDGEPTIFGASRGDTMAPDVSSAAQPAYEKAIELAVTASGADRDALSLTQWESATWRDASLGCPKEGQMYAQVITPGYRFVFEAGGETYEIHTNETGSSAVVCDEQATQ